MCLLPAAMGMFGGKAADAAKGGLLGGLTGAIGATLVGKKKKSTSSSTPMSTTTVGAIGPSPSGAY